MNSRSFILIVFVLSLLCGCGNFDPQAYVPGLESTATPTPTPTPFQEVSAPVSMTDAIPTVVATELVDHAATVCTNIPGGKLNVRFEAGDKSDVRGYLAESETVMIGGERQEVNGNLWVKLTRPIIGWVNSKYLCEVVSP
jgi:hypothetical protein